MGEFDEFVLIEDIAAASLHIKEVVSIILYRLSLLYGAEWSFVSIYGR